MIDSFNGFMSVILCVLTGWAVMSNKVKDGVVVKIGLVCLSLGFFGAFAVYFENPNDHDRAIDAVHALIYIGVAVCIFGYWLRTRSGLNRRIEDWLQTETRT